MTDLTGDIMTYASVRGQQPSYIINSISSTSMDMLDIIDDDNFYDILSSCIVISSINTGISLTGNVRAHKTPGVDFKTLARHWGILPSAAQQTIIKTTQQGVWTCLTPTLSRHSTTNDQMLCYKRLPRPCFTDTLIAGTPSRRGHEYAQVYSTSFAWLHTHPMTRKSNTHETLSLLFHCDGVPPVMTMDGSKEQTQGDFSKKL